MANKSAGIGGNKTDRRAYVIVMAIAGLALMAVASGESIRVEPYDISFKLNPIIERNYLIETDENVSTNQGSAEYDLRTLIINNSTNFAIIHVAEFDKEMDHSPRQYQTDIDKCMKNLGYDNFERSGARTIDGNNGFFYEYSNKTDIANKIILAQYWQSEINVLIISNFSHGITYDLINSIQIEHHE